MRYKMYIDIINHDYIFFYYGLFLYTHINTIIISRFVTAIALQSRRNSMQGNHINTQGILGKH